MNFIVTQDGKYWDRQLWLKRQELRDKMRRNVSSNSRPTDMERALGASAIAPLDPNDDADGIKRTANFYAYGTDMTNPPLWRAADGTTAITSEEIAAARNAPRAPDAKAPPATPAPAVPPTIKPAVAPAAPFRDNISPAELAEALMLRKAELSTFKWSKRVVKQARPEIRPSGTTPGTPAQPEEVDFIWRRDPVPIRWLKAPAAAPKP